MNVFSSSREAMQHCLNTSGFAVAHLYNMEKTMDTRFHDCCEIYYSISGGKQFFIDNNLYEFQSGDIFFIDRREKHCITQIIDELHERVVIFIHPDFLQKLSTGQTNLKDCFSNHKVESAHKLSLTEDEQKRFMYFVHKLSLSKDYGQEILDHAIFMELMVFLNKAFNENCCDVAVKSQSSGKHYDKIAGILSYINQHLSEDLSINTLAEYFFISPSYLSVIFKNATGTTINKYIASQRITLAKLRLSEGYSVTETYKLCGFNDYSNFLKVFTKSVGVSPKKYAQFSSQ